MRFEVVADVAAAALAGFHDLAVFGHKVPDTDAVCAAIAYSWELQEDGYNAQAFILGDLNTETEYVLKTVGLPTPPKLQGKLEKGRAVAVVDTNNPMELPEGIEGAALHSIVDHHKMAGLINADPLKVDMRPLCSAGGIVYARAKRAGRVPPKNVAGCMLSSILSDSLLFRSPTTTEKDKILAAELANITGLDIHEYGNAMLEAKGKIDHLSPKELVMLDTKLFQLGDRKVRVSVFETTSPKSALNRRQELVEAMKSVVKEQSLDDCLFFVVDILEQQAIFIASSESAGELVERAWGKTLEEDGTLILPGVLSRKLQIIPQLQKAATDSSFNAALMFNAMPSSATASAPKVDLGTAPAKASRKISVFGHKVPDTDAVCAAIAYTWELNQRGHNATTYVLGGLNTETEYVLKTLGLPQPALLEGALGKGQAVAVVDTNNPMELPDGIESATVHSIVDHHKMAGLINPEPLKVDMRPLCSAGSIVYERAKSAGQVPPKEVAGCMLSSILSDSLVFRSPTTTKQDKIYAAELAEITGLNIEEYGQAMLEAKGKIDHLSPKELVMLDTKLFQLGDRKVRVSVFETTSPKSALSRRQELVEAMESVVKEQGLDDCLFFVVDILEQQATFISSSETGKKLVEEAWQQPLSADGTLILPGVLSRKLQIIPKLQTAAQDLAASQPSDLEQTVSGKRR